MGEIESDKQWELSGSNYKGNKMCFMNVCKLVFLSMWSSQVMVTVYGILPPLFQPPSLHYITLKRTLHTTQKSRHTIFSLTPLTQLVPTYGDRPRFDSAGRGCDPQPWPPHGALPAALSAWIPGRGAAGVEIDQVRGGLVVL